MRKNYIPEYYEHEMMCISSFLLQNTTKKMKKNTFKNHF